MNRVSGPRMPGSEHIPFSPINPWGRKAAMPAGWKSPLERRLYQVWVDDSEKGEIPVGPAMGKDVIDDLHATINLSIKSGRITGWANPTIKPLPLQMAVGRVF
jgi:hypothetical protein